MSNDQTQFGTDPMQPDSQSAYTKLSTKIKRGSGTRDQDTTKVVTRHPDPETAAKKHQQALEALRASANAARTIQPDQEDDGDD